MKNFILATIIILSSCKDTSNEKDLHNVKTLITEEKALEYGLLPIAVEFNVPSNFIKFFSTEKSLRRGLFVYMGKKDTSGVILQQIDLFSMPDSLIRGSKMDHLMAFSQETCENNLPGTYKELDVKRRKIGKYQIPLLSAKLNLKKHPFIGIYIYTVGIFETADGEKVQMSTMTRNDQLADDLYSEELVEVFNSLWIE